MKCYAGFSYGGGVMSKLISTVLRREYSHTFMLFSWEDELIVLHADDGEINALHWDNFKSENKIIKMVEINDVEKIKHAHKYCTSRLGVKYGYLALVAIGLGMHYTDGEKTLICSEYLARALDLKFDENKEIDEITPSDVENAIDQVKGKEVEVEDVVGE